MKRSPLAPTTIVELPPLDGVRLATCAAGIKYTGRDDLLLIVFDRPAQVAGVFTRSRCPSAPVDWCRTRLGAEAANARAVVVNAGNANAFTGKRGVEATRMTADAAADAVGCSTDDVYLASTGVIGEPLDVSVFADRLAELASDAKPVGWNAAANAIMTTDTFPKLAEATFEVSGRSFRVQGIAKGSGMIAPDMATMLSFIATDASLSNTQLQSALDRTIGSTFNAITVDGDTSTSDTVLLFATGDGERLNAEGETAFAKALHTVLHELAQQTVRDGEGATKVMAITVDGAESDAAARRIAMSIANSPLVKTAVAGEDANWGRIVMAVGKAGERADRDRLAITFNGIRVAVDGERDPAYDEETVGATMKRDEIDIDVSLGIGPGRATVWGCDLTHDYVTINADYRS